MLFDRAIDKLEGLMLGQTGKSMVFATIALIHFDRMDFPLILGCVEKEMLPTQHDVAERPDDARCQSEQDREYLEVV